MKTQSVSEIEMLRAQVRHLQQVVTELEDRLAEVETENSDVENENVWGVWPYNWAVAGWEAVKGRVHSFQENAKSEEPTLYNDRPKRCVNEPIRAESYECLRMVK